MPPDFYLVITDFFQDAWFEGLVLEQGPDYDDFDRFRRTLALLALGQRVQVTEVLDQHVFAQPTTSGFFNLKHQF